MSRQNLKMLAIFFALLTIASLVFLAYTTTLPTRETQTTVLCSYTQDGTYDYIAKLKQPNYIYDNKSTLTPNEGLLYMQIVENLNLTFTYTFETNLNTNTTIKYATAGYIITARWIKTNFTIPQQTTTNIANTTTINTDITTIDVRAIQQYVSQVNSEVGVSTGNFNLTITTSIILEAENQAGTIEEPFTATLNLAFTAGAPEGNVILAENLQTTKTGEITETQTVYYESTTNLLYASYGTTVTALAGLAITSVLYYKAKPPTAPSPTEQLIQEIREPYEDIIVETTEETQPQGQTTITMKTIEDLVKIADMLSKPIIHLTKPATPENKEQTDTFYLIDNTTRYEYNITPTQLKTAKEQAREKPEEDEDY